MFSGIIETTGKILKITSEGSNRHFEISSDISKETYIDQSIAHNGVCLTVVAHTTNSHTVTAIKETLEKTNLIFWETGDEINIERSLLATSRIDGHFVQGHVDTTATCTEIQSVGGSWYFHFELEAASMKLIVSKGSIAINGVSLTVVDVHQNTFSVAIIPYTYQHTNFQHLKTGDTVNLEFDILGKYIVNYLEKLQPK
jgi:riboflavin synthase